MSTKTLVIILALAGVVLVVGGTIWAKNQPGKLDQFAQCLGEQGAKFYGAFWCPHCQAQKAAFGRSEKHLPYIECSTPDGQGQLAICEDAGISAYPTWEFADGERVSGEQELEYLAEKTGCELPE